LPEHYVLVFTRVPEGSALYDDTLRQLRGMGLERRVLLCDRLDYAGLLRLFASCDLGLLLYPNAGIGNYYQAPGRLTEYLACGLPIVATHFPGLELLVLKHQLGAACDSESPDAIAEALLRLGERPDDQREAERRRLRELARNEFAYEAQAWQIEKLMSEIAALGRAGPGVAHERNRG
jgi:glycosyltransferase involved in cell wall biosynthesis